MCISQFYFLLMGSVRRFLILVAPIDRVVSVDIGYPEISRLCLCIQIRMVPVLRRLDGQTQIVSFFIEFAGNTPSQEVR